MNKVQKKKMSVENALKSHRSRMSQLRQTRSSLGRCMLNNDLSNRCKTKSLVADSSIDYSAIDLLGRLPTATVLRRVFSPPSPPETYSERLSRLLPVASELWRERPPPRVDDSRLEESGPRSLRSQSGVWRSSRCL